MFVNNLLKRNNYNLILSFLSAIIFVYIILFEFILPINQILPRPSILIESIPSIFKDYSFVNNYFFTLSIIYLNFIVSYFLIKVFFPLIFSISIQFKKLEQLFLFTNYFLPIFFIFLFNIWFDNSIWGEIIFIFALVMGLLKTEIFCYSKKVKEEYIFSAKSLGLTQKELINKVIWKSFQPQLYKVFTKNHFLIWTYTLFYEFINKSGGLGKQFYLSTKYDDLVVIILLVTFLILTLFVFNFLMKKIKIKFFFWENLDE
ncbi:MAG: ABC transporter permease subunit [Melioribacteraceae bacterium]